MTMGFAVTWIDVIQIGLMLAVLYQLKKGG
jgi:hypothetical protein